jgi:hypothetical protein
MQSSSGQLAGRPTSLLLSFRERIIGKILAIAHSHHLETVALQFQQAQQLFLDRVVASLPDEPESQPWWYSLAL